jgi:hypothetical protein|tara:strand:+ start:2684 stop:2878 length:195 start_codon:yes stop_codon:yes gene_type:complete
MKKKKEKQKSRREREASNNSQFDPKIHELGRQGYGFQMKRGYKAKPEELSGRNLPFTTATKDKQ